MVEGDQTFEFIMEKIGPDGRFHTIYSMIFVVGLTMAGAMSYTNLILALNVPDHWCNVPGREETNYTMDEWKHLTLPKILDNVGQENFDNCHMYYYNFSGISREDFEAFNETSKDTISCMNGYTYDRKWYDQTIVSYENWVCNDDLKIANTFVASRIAEVIGTLLFGQLGDTIGRKPVYYVSIVLMLVGRIILILTTSAYIWFIVAVVLGSLAINSVFQSPLVVAMEISSESARTGIAMKQSLGWSIGMCIMPFLYWWWRDWQPFMWATTLVSVIFLFFWRYMIESPRWLVGKKRFREALRCLKTIARVNGRKFEMTESELRAMYASEEEEKVYGIASLFSTWRMARTTMIMAFSWCVVSVSYFTLLLYISRMKGNPFMNFFIQSCVEIPAYIVGKYLSDRIGRRFTNCSSFLISAITCTFIIAYSKDPAYETAMIYAASFMKFLNGTTFFAVALQAMEMYPTCLRQTGISLGAITGNAIGVLAPYFVYLGTNYDIRYPYYILLILLFLASTTGLFLPETLHQKLPDSLHEAQNFGKNQKFWSIPKAPKEIVEEEVNFEKEKLNGKLGNGV